MTTSLQGVILSPACLPGRFGMGEIGPEAWRWLQVLGEAGVGSWVIPHGLDSVMLLSFDLLVQDGALLHGDMAMLPSFDEHTVEREAVNEVRSAFLDLAARRFLAQCNASPLLQHALDRFSDQEAAWLDDVALFEVLQKSLEELDWRKWPTELANREPAALDEAMVSFAAEVDERKALHYLLHRQVARLQAHAETEKITIVPMTQSSAAEEWAGRVSERSTLDTSHYLDVATLFGHPQGQEKWRFTWPEVTVEVLKGLVPA